MKFINTTVDILPTKVYNSSGKFVGLYVYHDASYKYFGPEHLPFCILSSVLILSAITLLLLYPFSFFQRCLSKFQLRSHVVRIVVACFVYGWYGHTELLKYIYDHLLSLIQ